MKKLLLILAVMVIPTIMAARKPKVTSVRWASFNIRVDVSADAAIGASWQSRRDRVCQWVRDNQIDVVGFQEVLSSMMPDLVERLPEYAFVAKGRRNRETGDEMVPVFYRKDRYKELDHGHFWLSETPDEPGSMGWDTSLPRIATWVKLKDRQTGQVFVALSTHFDHRGTKAREESGKLIQQKMQEIAGKHPVMLAGDFNMGDTSPGYAAIVGGPYVLRDAYFMSPSHSGVRYTYQAFSTIAPEKAPRGDFIFVSQQIRVLSTHFEPDIPDAPLSDHNPIWADLEF